MRKEVQERLKRRLPIWLVADVAEFIDYRLFKVPGGQGNCTGVQTWRPSAEKRHHYTAHQFRRLSEK